MDLLDYRNGQYQGPLHDSLRHGPGVFIDDDLTLYASHWYKNQLSGPTLVYISHGKYIYGQWASNQLDGLAVFRSGQTVLVGPFSHSKPVNRCLIIFERHSFACILQQKGQHWTIIDSCAISSHRVLLSFVEKIGVPVPEHYFSLVKYVTHFAQESQSPISAHQSTSGCCYFGFRDGLGMVFNSNNGLVSIGRHLGEEVSEFGGVYESSRQGLQGNFEPRGETVRYADARPASKIYRIFQNIHRKSINFVNDYFDSKVKIFTEVENMLRSQLDIFNRQCRNKCALKVDLNDSFDYQEYNEEESLKMLENRDNIYGGDSHRVKGNWTGTPKSAQGGNGGGFKSKEGNKENQGHSLSVFRRNEQTTKMAEIAKKNLIENNFTPPYGTSKTTVCHSRHSPYRALRQDEVRSGYSKASTLSVYENNSLEHSKPRARANNHRYRNDEQIVIDDKMLSSIANTPRTNDIYKQSARARENPGEEYAHDFKLPTFKPVSPAIDETFNKISLREPQEQKREHSELKYNQNTRKNGVYQPGNKNYEEIEERRRRVLKEYREAVDGPKKQDCGRLKQYESPMQAMFSLPKEDHKYSEMKLLSVYGRPNASPLKPSKERNSPYTKALGKVATSSFTRKDNYFNQNNLYIEKYKASQRSPEVTLVQVSQSYIPGAVDRAMSPSKRKKSYQYTYE